MKHESYTCDRCKKKYESKPSISITWWRRTDSIERDLCGVCMADLFDWIEVGI